MHQPTPPTQDEHGDDVHPAFGAITAHRITSTPGSVLFDSEIQHNHFVRVTVSPMTRSRHLNRDWLHPRLTPLIEVDMSEAQWASFVSSMNTSAVPCTIRATESNRDVPGLGFAPRLALSAAETRSAAERAFEEIKQAMATLEGLDPKAGAKARREAMRNLHYAIENAPGKVAFAAKSLTEHTENVVQKARADVEAMVVNHAQQLGIDPAQALLAIEVGPGKAEN